jgi:type I restriction enzyme S subunit
LPAESFRTYRFPFPPEDEQRLIAFALERETARIDSLIAKKSRFIELLKEKRQSLVARAVTKGLNPNVEMRDSKLAWLGQVPKRWVVAPFRVAVWFQEGPGIMASDFRERGVPLLRISGVQGSTASLSGCNYLDPSKVDEKWSHFRVDLGDLLVSASATTGTVAEVGEETAGSIPYTGIIRMKALGAISKEYLKIFLGSKVFHEQIDLFKAGSTIQHYGPTHLNLMRVILPPVSEQESIARFVERVAKRIEVLIEKTETSIVLLRERRSALIASAVTGQIDLRGAA